MSYIDNTSTPAPVIDPATVSIWAGQVRAILPLFGGIGLGGVWLQHLTDVQISQYITAIFTIIGIGSWVTSAIWSRYEKFQQAIIERRSSVASAIVSAHATHAEGVPTIIMVASTTGTPIATKVSSTEIAHVQETVLSKPSIP